MLVGPEEKRFSVYHDLLTERSGFFKAARSSRWLEDPQTPTDLTDHDPEEFSNYLQLVYTSALITPDIEVLKWCNDDSECDKPNNEILEHMQSHYSVLINLYMLADKLQDLTSCNMVMDGILNFGNQVGRIPRLNLVKRIYNYTPSHSYLRAMIRDMIIYEVYEDYFDGTTESNFPKQLLFDIAQKSLSVKWTQLEAGDPKVSEGYVKNIAEDFPKCHYHQYDDENPGCE